MRQFGVSLEETELGVAPGLGSRGWFGFRVSVGLNSHPERGGSLSPVWPGTWKRPSARGA